MPLNGIKGSINVSSFNDTIMYKQKNKKRSERSRSPFYWIKRKLILVISAFMIGMGSVISEKDTTAMWDHYKMEQEDKKN